MEPKNCLELFCGTKSVGKLLEKNNYRVISLDFNKKYKPTHCVNILDFDYKQYPVGYFDIIWASPDCRFYSKIQNSWLGRRKTDGEIWTLEKLEKNRSESDRLLVKIFEIIDYLKPRLWCMENPQTGDMKNREPMKNKPFYDADYCMYSDWGYRKRTRFWTNRTGLKLKLCNKYCGNMIYKKKNGKMVPTKHNHGFGNNNSYQISSLVKRYRIPEKLLEILLL
jgi:site-specific DNA-cytosine methylase